MINRIARNPFFWAIALCLALFWPRDNGRTQFADDTQAKFALTTP